MGVHEVLFSSQNLHKKKRGVLLFILCNILLTMLLGKAIQTKNY